MVSVQILVLFGIICVLVQCKPIEDDSHNPELSIVRPQRIQKRFINPSLALGGFAGTGFQKIRTKRSEDECEKLRLCKLHARSQRNFISAFELYFVNRENAKLWDHRARSVAQCDEQFGGCYDYR